jgi:hypothetical protein
VLPFSVYFAGKKYFFSSQNSAQIPIKAVSEGVSLAYDEIHTSPFQSLEKGHSVKPDPTVITAENDSLSHAVNTLLSDSRIVHVVDSTMQSRWVLRQSLEMQLMH